MHNEWAACNVYYQPLIFGWQNLSMTIFLAWNQSSILICHTLILPHKNMWLMVTNTLHASHSLHYVWVLFFWNQKHGWLVHAMQSDGPLHQVPSRVMMGRMKNLLPHTQHFLWTHPLPCYDQPVCLFDVLSFLYALSLNISMSGSGTSSVIQFMNITQSHPLCSNALPETSDWWSSGGGSRHPIVEHGDQMWHQMHERFCKPESFDIEKWAYFGAHNAKRKCRSAGLAI